MAERTLSQIIAEHDLHKPNRCSECGSDNLEYLGIGEYKCKECGNYMYDDYGKVRKYVEEHPGATEADISFDTHVSRETIRQFVREERFEVVNSRKKLD